MQIYCMFLSRHTSFDFLNAINKDVRSKYYACLTNKPTYHKLISGSYWLILGTFSNNKKMINIPCILPLFHQKKVLDLHVSATILVITFWDFLMFDKMFLSRKVKRIVIISNKNCI